MLTKTTAKYPLTLKSRFGKVRVYKSKSSKWTHYTVVWMSGRKRLRKAFVDESLALTHAQKCLEAVEAGEAKAMTSDIRDIAYYKECESLLGGVPLRTAVEFYIACHGAAGFEGEKTVGDVFDLFLKDTEARGVSDRDLQTLRYHTKSFGEAHGTRPMISVKPLEFDGFYRTTDWSNRTKNNHRTSMIRAWKWARAKGFLPRGIDVAPSLSTVYKVEMSDSPGIFSPEDLLKIFEHLEDEWIPSVAIRAWTGMRTAEVERLDWSHVNMDEKIIILGRGQTKTNRRRVAHMPDNLVAWLKDRVQESGPVCPSAKSQRATLHAAKAAGVQWVHNGLRHSYISYQMALLRNAAAVAEQCGNSEGEVQRSYKANASEAEAKKYFAIFPAS